MSDPMEDPYAPARTVRRSEVRTEAEHFANRLRALGATEDEVGPVLESWDDLDDDDAVAREGEAPAWTSAYRTMLVSAPDAELRRMIATARSEYAYATTTDAQAADAEKRAKLAKVSDDAAAVVGRSVGDVLAWVDGDPDRARAVLELETAEDHGANRKTLVEPLTALVDPPTAQDGAVGSDGATVPTEAAGGQDAPHGPAGGQPDATTES